MNDSMKKITAAVLALLMGLTGCSVSYNSRPAGKAAAPRIISAPEAVKQDTDDSLPDRFELAQGITDSLPAYWQTSMSGILGEAGGKNRIYSPVNTWMALAMLAETTEGESRRQILDALHIEDMEELRSQAGLIWDVANHPGGEEDPSTCLMGASLWLSDELTYQQETLDLLAASHHAASFCGTMGDPAYDQELQNWLNDQTRGLLKDSVSGMKFDPETILALASTIYFKDNWTDAFLEKRNTHEIFHAADGDREAVFMHSDSSGSYYWGDHYSAIALPMRGGEEMWFLLPDEGIAPEELAGDPELMDLLTCKDRWNYPNSKEVVIHRGIPRFDVDSQLDLTETLQGLGITDIFDGSSADFSPVLAMDRDNICLSRATHAARVKIDEEGVEAAAYTMMAAAGCAMPPEEEVDFVLDRPFLFAITGLGNTPLFAGIVNHIE